MNDQSSKTITTTVMVVDESDVLQTTSVVGKSDWILNSKSVYHLYRDKEVFSTYAAYERLVRMANNTTNRVISKGTVQFRMADGRSLKLTQIRHVPSLQKKLISIGMLNSKGCNFATSEGTLRVS